MNTEERLVRAANAILMLSETVSRLSRRVLDLELHLANVNPLEDLEGELILDQQKEAKK